MPESRRKVATGLRHKPVTRKANIFPMINNVKDAPHKNTIWIILKEELPSIPIEGRREKGADSVESEPQGTKRGASARSAELCGTKTGAATQSVNLDGTKMGASGRRLDLRGTNTGATDRRVDQIGETAGAFTGRGTLHGTRTGAAARRPGGPGADHEDPGGEMLGVPEAVTEDGCAIDSTMRSGLKRLERARRPPEVRVKADGDWDEGGDGMKFFERCRDPEFLRTKGDDASDQDELCDQVGRGIPWINAQWLKRVARVSQFLRVI
ncbi:hypothetical protein C8R44DRAFT_753208 [Mycena epipterygia]|nr:hypothetical protein C8R44DRAFT_753208 [Mycena epipterygia]